MTRAVIYAAKSTQDKNLSIPEQLDDCREMADENGWEVVAAKWDENFTAYTGNRGPALAEAVRIAKEIAVEDGEAVIVAQHTSRFARGDGAKPGAPRALVELWHEWARANVRGRLVENDLAMQTSSAAAAQGEADHNESKRKSKSITKGLRRRARDRGKLVGGGRPYAYRWVDGELEAVPAEVAVVRRIFEDTANGVSQRALARRLTEEGVQPVHGGPFGQPSVGAILANPVYRGAIRHNGEEYPGVHQPIVSDDLWQRAAAMRAGSTRRRHGRWPKGKHLLTGGLLRCGLCGYAMTPRTDPGRKDGWKGYECYECSGRRARGVDFCEQRTLRREVIDGPLLEDLLDRYIDLDATRRQMEAKVRADLEHARAVQSTELAEVAQADAALARIRRDYRDGKISADEWHEFRDEFESERQAAQEAADRAEKHALDLEAAGAATDAQTALLEHLAALKAAVADGVGNAPDLNALRTVLREMFDRIELVRWPSFGREGDGTPVDSVVAEGDLVLVPYVRATALDGLDVRRAVLPAAQTDQVSFDRMGYPFESGRPVAAVFWRQGRSTAGTSATRPGLDGRVDRRPVGVGLTTRLR